ncbi:hypothetical protein R1sor_001227 [Riccia sorocarpa]|uniref:Uncharacterized protein n=1 Tax=Riccia sorocarpa TaxID=122646 RepID=A0ABD3GVC9_9MARC
MLEEIVTENDLELSEIDDTPIVVPDRELTPDKSDEEGEQADQPLPPDVPIREEDASGAFDQEVSVAGYPDIPILGFKEVAYVVSQTITTSEHRIVQAVAQPGLQNELASGSQDPGRDHQKDLAQELQKTATPMLERQDARRSPKQTAKPSTRSKVQFLTPEKEQAEPLIKESPSVVNQPDTSIESATIIDSSHQVNISSSQTSQTAVFKVPPEKIQSTPDSAQLTKLQDANSCPSEDSKHGKQGTQEEETRPVVHSELPQEVHTVLKRLSQSVTSEDLRTAGTARRLLEEQSQEEEFNRPSNDELFDQLYELGPYDRRSDQGDDTPTRRIFEKRPNNQIRFQKDWSTWFITLRSPSRLVLSSNPG